MRIASMVNQLSRMEAREEERARQRSLELTEVRRQLQALCTQYDGSSSKGAANMPAAPEQRAVKNAAPQDLNANSKHVAHPSGSDDTAAATMLLQPPPVISSFSSFLQNPPPGLQPVPRQVPPCRSVNVMRTTTHTKVMTTITICRARRADNLRQMAASAPGFSPTSCRRIHAAPAALQQHARPSSCTGTCR